MQDPVRELPGLINQLLQAPADKQRELIETYYTPDCPLRHALVSGRDREEVVRIFQAWRFSNVHLSASVQDIFISKEGNKVFVQFVQHVSRYMHGPLGFDIAMRSVLYLQDSPRGKLVAKQVDLHQFESILYHWPLLGPLLKLFVRRLLSWQMITGARLAAWGCDKLQSWAKEAGWGGALARAQAVLGRLWWRQQHAWEASPITPYSMR